VRSNAAQAATQSNCAHDFGDAWRDRRAVAANARSLGSLKLKTYAVSPDDVSLRQIVSDAIAFRYARRLLCTSDGNPSPSTEAAACAKSCRNLWPKYLLWGRSFILIFGLTAHSHHIVTTSTVSMPIKLGQGGKPLGNNACINFIRCTARVHTGAGVSNVMTRGG
jgi:hypothetical protein